MPARQSGDLSVTGMAALPPLITGNSLRRPPGRRQPPR